MSEEDYKKFLQEADLDHTELVAIETMDPIIQNLKQIDRSQFPTRRGFLRAKEALQNSLRAAAKKIQEVDLQRIALGILPSENPPCSGIQPPPNIPPPPPLLEAQPPPPLEVQTPLPPVFPVLAPQVSQSLPDLVPPVPRKRLVGETSLPPVKRVNKQANESEELISPDGILFYSKMQLKQKKDGSYTIEEADLGTDPVSVSTLVETALSGDLSKIEIWLLFKILLDPTMMTFITAEKTMYQRLLSVARKRQLTHQLVKKAIDGFCVLCQSTKTIGYKVSDEKGEIGSVGWCCWSRFSMAVNCCDLLSFLGTRVFTTPEEKREQVRNGCRQLESIIFNAEMFRQHAANEAAKE